MANAKKLPLAFETNFADESELAVKKKSVQLTKESIEDGDVNIPVETCSENIQNDSSFSERVPGDGSDDIPSAVSSHGNSFAETRQQKDISRVIKGVCFYSYKTGNKLGETLGISNNTVT